MPLHILQCDPGGEYLIPWAKRKLDYWHGEMRYTGHSAIFKVVQVSDGSVLYANSFRIAPETFIDKIRITAAARVWVYRALNFRTFFASNKAVAILPVPREAPEGLSLFTPVMFVNWSDFEADYLVANRPGSYLAFDITQTDPGDRADMHFVSGGTYVGTVDTKKLGLGVGSDTWHMARTGLHWARQHSSGTDVSTPTAGSGIDVYEPDGASGYYTTHYSWDEFFAPYVVDAGLSTWVYYAAQWVLRYTGGEEGTFDLPFSQRYNPTDEIADFGVDKNVGVFTWDYVTSQVVEPGPYPPGTTSIYTNYIVRRRVIGVLDSPAYSSELAALGTDSATGRPALGQFRVVKDTSTNYQIYSVLAFPTNSFTYSGQNLGVSDWMVSSTGKVIHVENITDYSGGAVISASIFVDGVQVSTTADGVISLPTGGATERWLDEHPVETDDGLAFLFRVYVSSTNTYHYYVYKYGSVSATGISHGAGASRVGPLLTTDAEHILYQDSATTQVWRDGVMVWGDDGAIQLRSHRKGPVKDQDNPRVFYVDGAAGSDRTARATISWVVEDDESRTYSVTRAPDLEPLDAGEDYDASSIPWDSDDLYVPFSALPK